MATPSLETQLEELLNEDPTSAMERERSTFDKIAAPFGRRLVLFGAGGLGRKVLRALRSDNIEPLAFSDNNAALWGTEIEGVNVLSPVDATNQFGGSAAFVVTIARPGNDFLSRRRQLLDLSCARVVPIRALLWKYARECLPHLVMNLPHRILRQKDDIWKACALLGDNSSRREFVAQIRWRLHQDYELPPPRSQEQFFPDDIFTFGASEVFVDCGAFDGDTVRAIIKRRTDFGRIIAIEPDPIVFGHLQQYLSELPASVRDKITPRRLGVGAVKGRVRFEASGGGASKVSDRGETEVECDTLDSILDGYTPTYIKMDIEGAEIDALRGAIRTLQENHAIWAVCVYHKHEDLWRIPLLMNSYSGGYSFFLRRYEPEPWESVCYAVPPQRLSQPNVEHE